jgi:hypothetical protein
LQLAESEQQRLLKGAHKMKISNRQQQYVKICRKINALHTQLTKAATPADVGIIAAIIDDLQAEAKELQLAAPAYR